MPAADPVRQRAGDLSAMRAGDGAGEPLLDVALESLMGGEFGCFRAAGLAVGMPLRDRGSIVQAATSGGRVAS
jgi:hypothetical protein